MLRPLYPPLTPEMPRQRPTVHVVHVAGEPDSRPLAMVRDRADDGIRRAWVALEGRWVPVIITGDAYYSTIPVRLVDRHPPVQLPEL